MRDRIRSLCLCSACSSRVETREDGGKLAGPALPRNVTALTSFACGHAHQPSHTRYHDRAAAADKVPAARHKQVRWEMQLSPTQRRGFQVLGMPCPLRAEVHEAAAPGAHVLQVSSVPVGVPSQAVWDCHPDSAARDMKLYQTDIIEPHLQRAYQPDGVPAV